MSAKFSIVITTIDSDQGARSIATAVLSSRLAACVQIFPMRSHYVWNDEMREENEFFLQMKAPTDNFEALAALIREIHTYDIPEILRVDIADGDRAYLSWVAQYARRD
jgi:periplasmic divalent cation tolerance protein